MEERGKGLSLSILKLGDLSSLQLELAIFLKLENLLYAGSGHGSVHSGGCPGRSSFHPYDMAKSVRDGSSFLHSQEQLSLVQSDGSCHCEGDHSGVESDGSESGFLD